MRDYHQHCKEIVYPMHKALYSIKQGDTIQTVKNTLLFICADYIEDHDADIIGLELKEVCKDCYNTITYILKVNRKTLDRFVGDLLTKISYMLNANNREYNIIYNNVGMAKYHYSYKIN